MKKVLSIGLIFIIFCTSCVQYVDNIDNYYNDITEFEAGLFMPKLDEIGDYKEIEYLCRKDSSFFSENSLQLIVKYEENAFLDEKERLETAYEYLSEPQMQDDVYVMPVISFSKAGFDFKIQKVESTDYPKKFGMVGISDERFEIAYLWVYCFDLDYICDNEDDIAEEMNKFIERNFKLD